MVFIRVAYFEGFEGADTLLIDVNPEGLERLIAWLREATSSGHKTMINNCPGGLFSQGCSSS
jgi:hypothetical protein